MKKGKVLCVYSPKGGVGKSIISANIAGSSYLMGKRTLLIDADLYDGGLSLFVNKEIKKNIYTLSNDIKNNKYESILDYVYNYNEGLDILCSTKIAQQHYNTFKERFEGYPIRVEVLSRFKTPKQQKQIIEDAKNIYDFIVIDTNSSYNDFNENIFNLCDEVLLILTNDIVNIKNMKNVITMFNDIGIYKYKVLYNSAFDFKDQYFSYEEMIDIIGANIDYTILREGFFKNITGYLFNNKIPILYKNNDVQYYSLLNKCNLIINDME
mgnify:CR=1 FL=1